MIPIEIIKRDGSTVSFDTSKIVEAISKATIRAEEERIEAEAEKVEKKIRTIDLFAGCGGLSTGLADQIFIEMLEEILEKDLPEDEYLLGLHRSVLRDSYQKLLFERERLQKFREELRRIRRLKTQQVSTMIRSAWLNRNSAVGRSNTGAVTDPMLLSMPTPPTSEAAFSCLRCGGVAIAFI